MAEKDYSATPLWKKLGIKDGSTVAFIGSPDTFHPALPSSVRVSRRASAGDDVIVFFATRVADLTKRVGGLARKLDPAGGLWIAYPKRSSGVATDVTFENVQMLGLDAGLVDNKSCSIDETWSAVRFVYRLADRPR